MSKCDVCGQSESVDVVCIPGVPISAGYCKACLVANAHPLAVLIANTACCGGLSNCNEEWKQMVEDSLRHLGESMAWFVGEVEEHAEPMR